MSPEDEAVIDAIVADSRAESGQPGVLVHITSPGGDLLKAYGTVADGSRPLTVDDRFRIGSGTKLFTAMRFFMAIDDGLVSLQDTLEQFVPGVPNGEIITMEQLLSHRAGVPEYTVGFVAVLFTLFPNWPWTDTGKDALPYIKKPSTYPPGTSYAYTNSDYILLGLVLEAVDPAGRGIKQILTEDIIDALGLSETQWPPSGPVPPPAAGSAQLNPQFLGAAGALVSTVGDLTKFIQAVRDHTLISAESFERWSTTYWFHETRWGEFANGFHIPLTYGYGLGAENFGSHFGHPGVIPNWGCSMFFERDSGTTILISENSTPANPPLPSQTRMWVRMVDHLLPGTLEAPPPVPIVRTTGIPSAETFGATRVFRWAPPGDGDGTIEIPHKVPYTL